MATIDIDNSSSNLMLHYDLDVHVAYAAGKVKISISFKNSIIHDKKQKKSMFNECLYMWYWWFLIISCWFLCLKQSYNFKNYFGNRLINWFIFYACRTSCFIVSKAVCVLRIMCITLYIIAIIFVISLIIHKEKAKEMND